MAFSYHVFISYSSEDRVWAERLTVDLNNRGVNCFLDRKRIEKGKEWEPQLIADLTGSRHFIVLWSENAEKSEWVREELVRFKIEIDPKATGPVEGRRLYAINLQGQNPTLGKYQGYMIPAIQQAYQEHPGVLNLGTGIGPWDDMVKEIAKDATADDPALPVPVAVLAMTTSLFQEGLAHPESEATLEEFLKKLTVGTIAELEKRYHPTSPFGWRPFGTGDTIEDLLTDLLQEKPYGINEKLADLKKPSIRWLKIDLVTQPLDLIHRLAQPLVAGPGLLVIDPISLFNAKIWRRYSKLGACFSNPQAAIVLLTPFPETALSYLRQSLSGQISPHLDGYWEPIPYNPGYANCGINVADKFDIRRLVLASLGRQTANLPPSGAESILRV